MAGELMNLAGRANLFSATKNIFVLSLGGDDGWHGEDSSKPKATLAGAVAKSAANQGDVIHVLPGHVEAVSGDDALNFNTAGVTILGYGRGASRPTLTFDTNATANMIFSAPGVTLSNFNLLAGIDELAGPILVDAADCALLGCEYRDSVGNFQTVDCLVTTANADRFLVDGFTLRGDISNAGAESGIQLVGGDGIILRNIFMDGDFGTACIENVTTAAMNLRISDCYLRTRNAADILITLVSTATGWVGPNIHGRLEEDEANITGAIALGDCNLALTAGVNIANADSQATMLSNIPASVDEA